MNDQFYEQLVKKKTTVKDIVIYIAAALLSVALLFLGFLFLGLMILPVICVIVFLIYHFGLSKLKVEYEYSIVNYDLQIDAIFNKEKRKELMSINLREAEMTGPAESLKNVKVDKVMNYTSGASNAKALSIIINKGNLKYNIMIEPDKIMKEHIKEWSGTRYVN